MCIIFIARDFYLPCRSSSPSPKLTSTCAPLCRLLIRSSYACFLSFREFKTTLNVRAYFACNCFYFMHMQNFLNFLIFSHQYTPTPILTFAKSIKLLHLKLISFCSSLYLLASFKCLNVSAVSLNTSGASVIG